MESLKQERTNLRRTFSRSAKLLEDKVKDTQTGKTEIISSLKLFEDKAERLFMIDELIKEQMDQTEKLDEKELIKEWDDRESYREKWVVLKNTCDLILRDDDVKDNASICSNSARKTLKLPKLEFKKFDGDLKNWIGFWAQFKRIHEDDNLANEDKFQYLIQATLNGSRARDVIESFPPSGDNYEKAIECLQSRFGQEELLVEVYIRELLTLILKNANSRDSSFSLCSLYDNLESQIRALETLKVTKDKCAAILYPLVESCLPEEVLRAWQRSLNFHKNEVKAEKLENLMKFLQSEVESEERIKIAMAGFNLNDNIKNDVNKIKKRPTNEIITEHTAAGLLSTSSVDKRNCVFCGGTHQPSNCFKARKISLNQKQDILRQKGYCFRCIKKGHIGSDCRVALKCIICNKSHDALMCPQSTKNEKNCTMQKEDAEESVTMASASTTHKVVLQTLVVNLRGPKHTVKVRALIDSGSQRSYILRDTAVKMGYKPSNQILISHSLFGGIKTEPKTHNCYKVYLGNVDESFSCNFEAVEQMSICDKISAIPKGYWTNELNQEKIFLSDCEKYSGPIEILLGADVAGKLYTGERKVLKCGLVAMKTLLGWTLIGKAPTLNSDDNLAMVVTSMFVKEASIADLWSLDVIGITDPVSKKTKIEKEIQVRSNFQKNLKVNEEGRYEVALPWAEDHLPLPTYKSSAIRRLENMTKKLHENNLYAKYEEVFLEWEKLGIIEEVKDDGMEKGCYLPHRPVLKENSTTKIRPVFDASTREKTSPSLNQCLETGPNLIELIPSLILRFREYKYGVIADIEKAFLQISVRPTDRDYLKFFWWDTEENKKLKTMRHTRVVFGAKSSPFLLGAVVEFHLTSILEDSSYDKYMINRLAHSFYVDNVVTSLEREEDIFEFEKEARRVMARGKFNLRGWQHSMCQKGENSVSVLGMYWDILEDTLRVNLDWLDNYEIGLVNKRTILSIAHKVFDPIGITCPVLLFPKLLLQKMWKIGISWDEEVDSASKDNFKLWYGQLHLLRNLKIDRWINYSSKELMHLSIHTFCDASLQAYAAVVFIRIETVDEVRIHLLSAKSRISPTKPVTVPRLELIAATVGARLYKSVLEGLKWEDVESHFWTDSTTVLAWIRREEIWSVFVNNRIKEIRSLTNVASWKHIPGNENPADLPSRGCDPIQLLTTRWWEGPCWLRRNPTEWPSMNTICDEEAINSEKRKTEVTSHNYVNVNVTESPKCKWCDVPEKDLNPVCLHHAFGWYFRYFSNVDRIVRMIAWMFRFLDNCRTQVDSRRTGELTYEEIRTAEKKVIKFIQEESFTDETDKKLKSISTFKDEEGLIRLKTKIVYRKDAEDFRRPFVLPSNHPVVRRLILTEHLKNLHAGPQILMNILREHFWILDARRTIRSVLKKCRVCLRYEGRSFDAPTAPLPENRIKDAAAFEIIGVDAAGPLYLRDGTKAWICLYTCAVYRAIHMELLTSLSTETFLMGFRRFIARRGRPSVVYSDNGTNFVGASHALEAVEWDRIEKYSLTRRIEWKFNPPTAAWWGGFWERLVRTTKQILRKVLGKACLSYEEMVTILCDVEAIINSRPLSYMSESSGEVITLSPNYFIQDIRSGEVPDLDVVDEENLRKRVKYRMKLKNDLRKRFRSEYLGLLIQRTDSVNSYREIVPGDVVLIGSDNVKRLDWPLGLVLEVLPGKDDITRLVRLRTARSEVLRPIQKIYSLELSSKDSASYKSLIKENEAIATNMEEVLKDYSTRSGRVVKVPERMNL